MTYRLNYFTKKAISQSPVHKEHIFLIMLHFDFVAPDHE